jgi:2,5-diketo-D-gluconate reductase B
MQTIQTQGVAIPRLGFGTFRMPSSGSQPVVESALELGYRHIDTAAMYENEAAVGAAIAASDVLRNNLFVTTKVWHDQLVPDAIRKAFDIGLRKLKVDYVDLYMVHWPSRDMDIAAVMETLIALREEGRTRAIGVCNFNMPMIRKAVDEIGAPVAALQIEYHPFLHQSEMLAYLGGEEYSADRLRAPGPGTRSHERNAAWDRREVRCQRSTSRDRLAAGPGRRHRHSEGPTP